MSYRILHYSDPHFGAVEEKVAEAAIVLANEIAPDMVAVTGDFTMRGRHREFKAARAWLDQLPQPQIVFPGNHDVPGLNDLWDRFFTPFKRYRDYILSDEEPSADLGTVGKIVTANSSTPFGWHKDWSRGFLGPAQSIRISSEFHSMDQSLLRVLGIHHPLLGARDKSRALVAPMPLITKLLLDSRVDLIMTGHFHQSRIGTFPEEDNVRNLVVSQAPSICSTRLKGEPNGFHLINLDRSKIEIELWRWNGDTFTRCSPETYVSDDNNWKAAPR